MLTASNAVEESRDSCCVTANFTRVVSCQSQSCACEANKGRRTWLQPVGDRASVGDSTSVPGRFVLVRVAWQGLSRCTKQVYHHSTQGDGLRDRRETASRLNGDLNCLLMGLRRSNCIDVSHIIRFDRDGVGAYFSGLG